MSMPPEEPQSMQPVSDKETLSQWAHLTAGWETPQEGWSVADIERMMQEDLCWYIRDSQGLPIAFLRSTIVGLLEETRPKAIMINGFRFARGAATNNHAAALLMAPTRTFPETLGIMVANQVYEYAAAGACGFVPAMANTGAYLMYLELLSTDLRDWEPPEGTILLRPPQSLAHLTTDF